MKKSALIIGGAKGIGAAMVKHCVTSKRYVSVHCVCRELPASQIDGVLYHVMPTHDEGAIQRYCEQLSHKGIQCSLIICSIGILHDLQSSESSLSPEKRLEDLNQDKLLQYLLTNTVIPALWLKHTLPLLKGEDTAHLVFLSARVASLSDNKLGGWYGYRASKAALNMLIKSAQIECQRRAKNIAIVSYHPGTVDTGLSQPFQQNVPKENLFSADFTAACLQQSLQKILPSAEPHYIDWQGKAISW